MGCPKFTPKTAPSLRRSRLPSNTSTPQPTPLTIPNGIPIRSAILPQYTFRTDRQTDRYARQQVCNELIESDTLKSNLEACTPIILIQSIQSGWGLNHLSIALSYTEESNSWQVITQVFHFTLKCCNSLCWACILVICVKTWRILRCTRVRDTTHAWLVTSHAEVFWWIHSSLGALQNTFSIIYFLTAGLNIRSFFPDFWNGFGIVPLLT